MAAPSPPLPAIPPGGCPDCRHATMTPATDDDADDRTVIRPPSSAITTPRPAADSGVDSASAFGHMLPEGTRIGGFEITGLIGEGGFGIVYLAYDPNLERHVALKEYMPSSLAARAAGGVTVSVKSPRHAETFSAGLKSFVNEARLLARFDHPSLVKVYRFWEANGTAYMAMPYYEGPTLKQALAELGHRPDEALLRAWLVPLLDAMAVMHAAQCYHRDIAPDNILLTAGGPLLLDFGAARRVIGDMTQALTVVLKPGYAPIEQYGDVPTMTQGPWTDLYALASVVYYAITGKAPMSSVERLIDDRLQPLVDVAAGQYGDAFLEAIDRALSVRPKGRPQDVAEFRALLGIEARDSGWGTTGSMPLSTPLADGPRTGPRTGHPRTGPRTDGPTGPATRAPTQSPTRADIVTAPAPVSSPPAARTQPGPAAPVPEHPAVARPTRTRLYVGAGVLVAAAAVAAGLLLGPAGEPAAPPAAPMISSTP